MNTSTRTRPAHPASSSSSSFSSSYRPTGDLRPLAAFTAIGLPVGWVLLSIPLVTHMPLEPFVLGTLFLGLVLPAVVLTRRDPRLSVRALLRDTVRLPRPWWLLVLGALLIPVATAGVAALAGVAADLSGPFLIQLAVGNIASSFIIVNLWEEMAWAGFVQRRATARWGYVGGSVVTALLFTGIHLPLSLYGAANPGDVAYNVAVMVVSAVGLRLLIGGFDRWGRGSILALGLMHSAFNASSALIDPGFDWIRYSVTFALGLAAVGVVAAKAGRGSRRSTVMGRR